MKTFAVAATILATAMAQDIQSKPFNLQLVSDDAHLNGQYVGACHSGAAIESACIGTQKVTMHLNSSSPQSPDNGLLTWALPIGMQPIIASQKYNTSSEQALTVLSPDPPVDSAMRLIPDPNSNVAQGIFEPGPNNGLYVNFVDDKMVLVSTTDDTQVPVAAGQPLNIDNWYVCDTYFTSYRYKTLSWVYGNQDAKPQNPTCVKVSAKRVYE